jgi:nucleotide-binding universal stress UspA family protein
MNASTHPGGTIVVGVDGSEHAERALAWAAEQASLERRPLTVLNASDPFGTNQSLYLASGGIAPHEVLLAERDARRSLVEGAAEHVRVTHPELEVRTEVPGTDARLALLEASNDAWMIVVGSRGRGPVASLVLGSVSVAVSRLARCPVVVVRPTNRARRQLGVSSPPTRPPCRGTRSRPRSGGVLPRPSADGRPLRLGRQRRELRMADRAPGRRWSR